MEGVRHRYFHCANCSYENDHDVIPIMNIYGLDPFNSPSDVCTNR
nr:hypothetical protein [Metallosphaera tengchongensis]